MSRNKREPMDVDIDKAKELMASLWSFVTWRTTPQGFDYWENVMKNVEGLVETAKGKESAP